MESNGADRICVTSRLLKATMERSLVETSRGFPVEIFYKRSELIRDEIATFLLARCLSPISVLEELLEVVCRMSLLRSCKQSCGSVWRIWAFRATLSALYSFTVLRLLFMSYKECRGIRRCMKWQSKAPKGTASRALAETKKLVSRPIPFRQLLGK